MKTSSKTLALIIDGDNAQLNYTKQIIQFFEVFGTLTIKQAYGDWTQLPLSSHRQSITDHGVNCVQQNRVGKNATDFRLAMDMALVLDKGEVDTYIIVSSDGDFAALCERIIQKGAQVIGIGSKSNTSSELRNACNLFFNIEEIVEKLAKTSTKSVTVSRTKTKTVREVIKTDSKPEVKSPAAPKSKPKAATVKGNSEKASKASAKSPIAPNSSTVKEAAKKPSPTVVKAPAPPKAKPIPIKAVAKKPTLPVVKAPAPPKLKPAKMLKILIEAHQKTPQEDGWAQVPQLREVLRKVDQHFDQRFANKKLTTWLKGFPENFEVDQNRVRMR